MISECGSSRLKRKKDMIENCMAAQAKDLHDMNADVVNEDALIMKQSGRLRAEVMMLNQLRSNGRLAVYEVKKRISVG